MKTDWKKVDDIARFLEERLGEPPQVHLVMGSGLSGAAGGLEDEREVSFEEIPGWPESTVEGHAGKLKRGRLAGVEVLVQLGRIHLYEGYTPEQVVLPVRAGISYGAETVILTNAAGGISDSFRPGDLMILEDHINLTGRNPLMGANEPTRGARFPDMTDIYTPKLRAHALEKAADLGITLHTGVYAGLTGPSYETPAEVRMLSRLGADAVGMSTVLEAIAARHLGARIAGISCITNVAAVVRGATLTHDEVKVFAARAADDMTRLVAALMCVVGGQVERG